MIITQYTQEHGITQFMRGKWMTTKGATIVADEPPPTPSLVYTPGGVSEPAQLALGISGYTLTLADGTQIQADGNTASDAMLWICKASPQKVQLDELFKRYPKGSLWTFAGRFGERDLQAIVTAYKPALIMAVLGDTEVSFLRRIFTGDLVRAEMSVTGGMPYHQRFLEYRAIEVVEWR